MIFDMANHAFMAVGIGINTLALVAIAQHTPQSLRDYSIIIFNTALNDLLAMVLHSTINARLFIHGRVVALMASGPCRLFSDLFCEVLFELIHNTIMQTFSIIGISFWYRARSLRSKGAVGWWKLQAAIIIAYFPQILHFIAVFLVSQPREFFEPFISAVYGFGHSSAYAVYGYIDAGAPSSMATINYCLVFPSILYTYIFFTRRAAISILSANAEKMSKRTREMHHALVKVLSIHAMLPGCAIFSFVLLFLQMSDYYHSVEMEKAEYTIAVIPALVNPVLTLYYIRPYRRFVANCLPFEIKAKQKASSTVQPTKHSFSNAMSDF